MAHEPLPGDLDVPGPRRQRRADRLQIVGRTYCDADVFQAAMAYETAVGDWFNAKAKRPSL